MIKEVLTFSLATAVQQYKSILCADEKINS